MIGISDSFKAYLSECLCSTFENLENSQQYPSGYKMWLKKWAFSCYQSFVHLEDPESTAEYYESYVNNKPLTKRLILSNNHIDNYLKHSILIRFTLNLNLEFSPKTSEKIAGFFNQYIIGFIDFTINLITESELLKKISVKQSKAGLYKELISEVTIPIIILDSELRIFDYNDLAHSIFKGLKINNKFFRSEVIGFDTNKILNYQLSTILIQGKSQVNFESYLDIDKEKRFFRVMIKKLHLPNVNFEGLIIMLDDLTNRKKIEQRLETERQRAEEADHLKTAFLANMSHEIRTPMNAIVGFSELLVGSNPTKQEMTEYLGLIRKSSNDLLNIIEDIIDVAKIESKQLKIKKKPCKPHELLLDLHKVYAEQLSRLGSDNIQLLLKIREEDKKIMFITDPERLKQVLANLLSNAIKFTEEGWIEMGYEKHEDNKILFFVKDSGIGVPSSMQDKIFERFFQVEDHAERNTGGTGLGLTISMNIVKLLGGQIQLKSIVNKGSYFHFDLPFEEVHDTQIVHSNKNKKDLFNIPDLQSMNILIAEDEESNFFFLSEILKKTKANLIRANTGLEAINITEQSDDIDLILMDIKMPEINGLEAIKYIHRIKPEIPIIAQTANAMDNDRATCMRAGCVDYLSKPIDKNSMMLIIEKHLKKKPQPMKF